MAEDTAAVKEMWARLGKHLGVDPDASGDYTIESGGVQLYMFRVTPTAVTVLSMVVPTHVAIGSPITRGGLVGIVTKDPDKAILMFEPIPGFSERLEVGTDANYVFHSAVAA